MERETALIAADIEGAGVFPLAQFHSPRPIARRCVIQALIEKSSGFLAGAGIVVKRQAIQVEAGAGDGRSGVGSPQRLGTRGRQSFHLADARIGRSRMTPGAIASRSTRTQVSAT